MKKGLTVLLTCAVLAGSTLAQAQEQAYGNTIVSNLHRPLQLLHQPCRRQGIELAGLILVEQLAAAIQHQTQST